MANPLQSVANSDSSSAIDSSSSLGARSSNSYKHMVDAAMAKMDSLKNTSYEVTHTRNSKHWWHHSQILIRTSGEKERVFNFGLFRDKGGKIVIDFRTLEKKGYVKSDSYDPNPLTRSGAEIKEAFKKALDQCGGDYGIRTNNCQKFAGMFMANLGVTHNVTIGRNYGLR